MFTPVFIHLFRTLTLILCAVLWNQAHAQLAVTTGQTAQQLAEIIAGPGVVVSNATITGDPSAIGAFNSGANNPGLGIGSGVIMSSGAVADAAQPNGSFASTSFNLPGDPFLEAQAGEQSNDAIVLQFDFVPNADFVTFNYVFGSEEYPEWTCSFNDIFAFTIQGVTVPSPQTNIALVPGTNIPVAINTVSDDVGCMIQSCGQSNIQYYVDNSTGAASQYVVYDGLTVVLSAEANVICGETYRLRLMLSDGGDWSYDSGCFIEENSLTTGSVIVETATASADSTAYEGCTEATVTLTLNGPAIAQDFPVPIWISDQTAEMGVDFPDIPQLDQVDSVIVIPAGQNTVSFTISPINDNMLEGVEYVEFTVVTSTCGLTSTFRIYMDDILPISTVTSNDTTICTGNAIVWCQASGGGGSYTYTWDNGMGVADTIYPAPGQTTMYHVMVEDNCGSEPAMDSVLVIVDDGPDANAGNDVSVCVGGSIVLNASSNDPTYAFMWNPPTYLSDPNVFNPVCTPQADMEYVVTVTRPDGCFNTDTMTVTLTPPPTGQFSLPAIGCTGVPMIVEYTGNATPSAQYNWQFAGGTVTNGNGQGPYAVMWNAPGVYDVALTVSWNGCLSPTEMSQIEILAAPVVNAGADVSFCSGGSATIGSPAVPAQTYSWSPVNGVADPTASATSLQLSNPTHDPQTIPYVLTANDQGCVNRDTLMVTVLPIPTAGFAVPAGMCFDGNSFDLLATGFFSPNATFSWDFGPNGIPQNATVKQPQDIRFAQPGQQSVSLTVTDNGCVSQPFVEIIEVYEMPVADLVFDVNDGCEPLTVNFQDQSYNGNSTLYHVWDFGNGSSSNQQSPSAVYDHGVYTVSLRVTTGHGCSDEMTVTDAIEAYWKPHALFEISDRVLSVLDAEVTVTNLADSIVDSEFIFHPFGHSVIAFQAQYTYSDTGTYRISQIVTTANGCKDTIIGSLKVEPLFTLYIPSAFTPDNNRVNEVWVPQGEGIKDFSMTIYDRWNEELFHSANINHGWDGTYKGRPVQQGVYIYSIDVMDILGEPHRYRGSFSLIR